MHWIVKIVLKQRMLVLLGAAAVVILGAVSWNRLPIDAFPDVTNVQVMILTEAEGLAPVDVEQQVSFPIEYVMGGLPDVKDVRSLSKSGLSRVVVVFEDDVDIYFARQIVFERLQVARDRLPPGTEPELGPISTGLGEIFQYTLESESHSLMELRTIQDWLIAPQLRPLDGVNEVNSFGGFVKQYHIIVDPDRLLKYDLALHDITQAVAGNNANAAGSFIVKDWEQEYIRSVGLYGAVSGTGPVEDIGSIVLGESDGTPLYLKDVAEVRVGPQTRQGAVSRDGKGEVVAGMVIMLKGANSRDVVTRVKDALPRIQGSLPEGVKLNVFYDRIDLVRAAVGTVGWALMQGCVLVILVLFLVLGNLRASLLVALSLPLTALAAFIMMDQAQVTANLMSLGGLAIAIGMVVDGSIVVTENVVRHLGERSGAENRIEVIAEALREVARPIVFSILIIAIVFIPLFALEGIEGKMFEPLALTIIFAMLGSLIVALTIVPAASSMILGKGRSLELPFLRAIGSRISLFYRRVLVYCLDHRKLSLGAAGLLFALSLAIAPLLGSEFMPALDEGAIAINVVRLPNASLDGSVATSGYIEKKLLAFPEVQTVVSKTGRAEISEDPMGPEQSDILIVLEPRRQWKNGRSRAELVAAMQAELARVPGIRPSFSQPIALRVNELISGIKSDLAVKIFGPDLDVLEETAGAVASAMSGVEGARDVKVEQISGFDQLEIVPKRRAMARYGINTKDLNELVEIAIGGKVATTVVDEQMRFAALVRFPENRRDDVMAVEKLLLSSPTGSHVPLGLVADISRVEAPAQISRENNVRRVVVEANVRGRDLGGFVDDVRESISSIEASLPPGYWVDYGGTFENQRRAMARLALVVPTSILLIFIMLFSAFRSFRSAGIVILNLPFALVGGVALTFIAGINLSVSTAVGFIALFGIAVQNGTVLVTFMNQLRERGLPVREAVLEACRLRLRALVMTAATTVLGLAPMLWAMGPGGEVQRPLAIVVIGGMTTSLLLTLLVLPVMYEWLGVRHHPS
ncbi:MAG: efflux RND transporter permease subunit [Deltaproteobacteria bacterium]|nr:efflux RND transporter permease subunit [Deltaproteobacteria bacterium]